MMIRYHGDKIGRHLKYTDFRLESEVSQMDDIDFETLTIFDHFIAKGTRFCCVFDFIAFKKVYEMLYSWKAKSLFSPIPELFNIVCGRDRKAPHPQPPRPFRVKT